jgi:hypothetical protein
VIVTVVVEPTTEKGCLEVATNDEVLLNQLISERAKGRTAGGAEPLADDVAFEIFACEQALRDYDLTDEEIVEGIVGGGDDGGFDGIFTFMNDVLLSDESEIYETELPASKLPKEAKLELVLVQAKQGASYTETALEKAQVSIGQLLDLNASEDDLKPLFRSEVIQRAMLFRDALLRLVSRGPSVSIRFIYATKGDTSTVNTKVQSKAALVEKEMKRAYSKAKPKVVFLGAAELWTSATSVANYSLDLPFVEQLGKGGSHILLVRLADYRAFITSDDGALRRHIFDWNVRDWQGSVEVNKEITESLIAEEGPEIWWLNNGVTIVCSSASSVGNKFHLEDVQIVNGLQTSVSIFNALKDIPPGDSRLDRHLVVRILATDDDDYRDKVIRATNRQTKVPDASLRATDPLQRQIESYLASSGLYYDRRRNYYKNNGKPPSQIVGIIFLAQAMLSVAFATPNVARARPGSVMKDDDAYARVFDAGVDLAVFLTAAKIQRSVDLYLDKNAVDSQERINLKFYLATMATAKLVGNLVRVPSQLTKVAREGVLPSEEQISQALTELRAIVADEWEKNPGLSFDKLMKGQLVIERVTKALTS